jgi:signal transduction histidine kinase/CheY-like chemotaxis protein
VLLVFSVQCAVYTAFCLAMIPYYEARTIPEAQVALDRFVSIGVLVHAVAFNLYAYLGARRDHVVRACLTTVIVFLALLNQWAPLRGTIIELQTLQLPGGATSVLPIRTPPGVSLLILYVAVLATYCYGLFIAVRLWPDRVGAFFVGGSSVAAFGGATVAILVDYAHVRAPYIGAWPHAAFVFGMAFLLSREYSARGTELRAHRERLEELVATRTRELELAKAEAERAARAKSQFLAHISHEIRTPLHVMLSQVQLLERDLTLGGAQRQKLGTVSSSGRHLQTLITDVLEMSKIEAGRPELVESPFDLWAALVDVERMFAVEAATKGIELRIARTSELPRRLLGDGAKAKQTLINLTGNALKFTTRGAIRLEASACALADGSSRVTVIVADTGVGIAPEDVAKLFRPFEQLDAGKRAGGTGLGLAISLAHARRMGGDLQVESTPGVGSTFTFTFVATRVLPEEPAMLEESAVIEARTARYKALIVDDVPLNRDLLSEVLSGNGFETRAAADGADAISLHDAWRPDLVLIDLRMRGMGGLEAIRRLRRGKSAAAIGALSASPLEEDERMALALGADFFMRKPYDYDELLDQISSVLARSAGVPAASAPLGRT